MDPMHHQIKELLEEGETLAIATIVSTLGSTPREVGAKMVITASGGILGTIGGGCGEADVRREAIQVIRTRKPKMVRVELLDDITSDSPAVCGGIMNVFVDPWYRDLDGGVWEKARRLIEELILINGEGAPAVVATVLEVENCNDVEPGEKCLIREGALRTGTIRNEGLLQAVIREAEVRLQEEESKQVTLDIPGTSSESRVFFDVVPALRKAIIVGAGHIAIPLVKLAKILDFHVTVLDDRILYASRDRFPEADEILVGDMATTLRGITVTPHTYVVLITRGHQFDEPCLREVINSSAKYIGMIGSKRRIKACFLRFRDEEGIPEERLKKVYAPIGLDINAESPQEIALAIASEMIKVRRGGGARSLSGH